MKIKTIIIFIILSIVLIVIGFAGGFYTKTLMDEAQLIKEKEKQTSLAALMSKNEINQLKEKIINNLLRKGYNYEDIKEIMNKEGALEDE